MELKEGTRVFSADGEEMGKLNRFVLNPVTKQVTHIVIEKGLLFPEDKVIPIDWVANSQPDQMTLSKPANQVEDLPPFEEVHFVELDEDERQRVVDASVLYAPSYYWYPSFGTPAFAPALYPPSVAAETEQNIPRNTVALQEGADVISADGTHVGDVERVFTDAHSNRATHFLISQGILLKARKLVPMGWVSTIKENEVHLGVGDKTIDRLPDYQE